MLTKGEARRIAVKATRLPEPLGKAAGDREMPRRPWSLRTMGKRLRFGSSDVGMRAARPAKDRKPGSDGWDRGTRTLLSQEAVGIALIAKETGLTRQTIYRIKDAPASAEAALAAWGL
jgi:hypothetical protein